MSDEHLAVESRVGADPRRRPSVLRGLRDLEPDLQRIPGNLWTLFVCGSYLAIVTWSLARHVLWRDEAQLWLVARASGSLPELLTNMTYENRPILWRS
jgi:predicted acylesterase/phospholipase RssA